MKRRAVRDMMDRHGLSERRACEPADLHRTVFQDRKQDRGDEALRRRLRELANERRRFGQRRPGILLARERVEVTHIGAGQGNDPGDRLPGGGLFRICREEGLAPAVDAQLKRFNRPASLELRKSASCSCRSD